MTGTNPVDAERRPDLGDGRVFVSHVEEDAPVALSIVDGLEAAGYPTWCYERDALPGPSYLLQTGREIERSAAVVLVISPNSLSSNQVTSEVVRAHESGRPFVPVLVGISHVEFAARQPEWREALGSATSITVPASGPQAIVPRIVQGLVGLGIEAVPGYEPRSGAASIVLPTAARRPGAARAGARHTMAYVAVAVVFVVALIGVGLAMTGGGSKEAIDNSSNTQKTAGDETSTTNTNSDTPGTATTVPPPSSVPAGSGGTPKPTAPAGTTSPPVTSRPPATTSPPPPQTTSPPPPPEEDSTVSTAAGQFYVFPPSVDEEWCHPDRIDCETNGPFLVLDLSYEGSGGMNVNDAFLAEARQSTVSWAGGSAGYRDIYVETFTDFVQVVYSPVPASPPDGDFFLHWPNNSQVRLEVY